MKTILMERRYKNTPEGQTSGNTALRPAKRVKVKDAAERLGVSEQYIRIGLQTGRLPFGTAVKMSSKWTYHISETLLFEYEKR